MTETLFDRAVMLHQAGNLTEARNSYEQILQKSPRDVNALNFMGVADIQMGDFQRSTYAFKRAIALKPDFGEAYNNLGVALKELKRNDEAIACCEKALSINPDYAEAHYNHAVVLNAINKKEEAVHGYQKAISINPNYIEAHNNLGIVLNDLGRVEEAAVHYQKALSIDPDFPFAHCNMGGIHLLREEANLALASFKRALELRPEYTEALVGLSKTFLALERFQDARSSALRANQLEPDNVAVHAMLGKIHTELAESDLAESRFSRALSLDPLCEEALLGLAHLSLENGQMEKARELFGRAIEKNSNILPARAQLAQAQKVTAADENFMALQAIEKQLDDYPAALAIALHYALGKCYDDIGDHAKAFPHFLAGGRLKRETLTYDQAAVEKQFSDVMQILDQDTVNRLRGGGDPSPAPIFVLGMPRSGTTLTEQIIASHPDVHGAGELSDLFRVARRKDAQTGKLLAFPNNLRSLDQGTLAIWGAEYLAALKRHAPDALRITDKMPANFMAIGLIHVMLPNAKIIHVKRNPVDTCLSCFTRLFKNNYQGFTYDLAELGRYYVNYARIMDHWRNVLPSNAFMEVQYEEIVADQETQAQRLIEYCGLEWNEACLSFYKTRRTVRTASLTQVHQPIYTSSIERWRPYESFLEPLLGALGDLVPNRCVKAPKN